MELFANLAIGLEAAVTLENLLYCFVGCLLGTLVGVLPGIGPAATIAMLLPATFTLGPAPALIMMAGIYYGAQYGGPRLSSSTFRAKRPPWSRLSTGTRWRDRGEVA
jgi:putative tricarboxylic transport membrane protein